MYKINISIDDVNPKKDWRIIGEPTEKYLEQLYKNFGCKTTLFIPSNHHNNSRISQNKQWIHELKSIPYIELAAHGHYHDTSDRQKWGECEFSEITHSFDAAARIKLMIEEWSACDTIPHIWKSPGWVTSRASVDELSKWFKYAVVHPIHNHNLMWKSYTINTTDYSKGIPPQDANIFILSHIFGNHDNTWNDNFYNWVNKSMEVITKNLKTEMNFIKEF